MGVDMPTIRCFGRSWGPNAVANRKVRLPMRFKSHLEISKLSKKKSWVPEGCLSVRWLYGKSLRHEKATIRAYDENGKLYTYGGAGLIAQVFQHETDHLNGTLFIDHAKEIEELRSRS